MTNFKENLKKYEMAVWENGSAWQKGRIAYRHGAMEELTTNELTEIVETLAEKNFIAEMSDDWKVTCSEKRENNAIAAAAKAELEK